ncbi:hypothetical protein J3R30DRAFT_3442129 [Lentinula aciculospora]|uniref:Methyltransferase domain-containing protein n=1 Tax=Lentinula aciculospora TaxID=153920 RepID=A0A9W9ANE4_9AGAR|nr:hypothetical protein J3R30DRAFT_3442129 [Lentinula aciculospora]
MQKTVGSIVASSSPPRSSINSSIYIDGRRHTRLKETQFNYKHGQKLHSFEPEKAPYPISYDKEILELEHLDGQLVKFVRQGSVSFIDFSEAERPQRCLDLGCGTGSWVIEAAKQWLTTEFVGFDLVNVQLKIMDHSLEERIRWVYGNFLTTKLPFEDDEFDHIHIQSISLGVPENKWNVLFDEIFRVLRPGGSVEMMEDDIIFPSLPRWFTAPMRAKPRRSASVHLPEGSVRGSISSFESSPSIPNHDHALLESLHKSVFEHRFINTKPTAVLPSYFSTYFRQNTLGPVLNFFMPPLPPLQPLSPQLATVYAVGPFGLDLEQRASVINTASPPLPTARPISVSFSSAPSKESSSSASGSSQGSREMSHPSPFKLSEALSSVAVNDTDDQNEDNLSPPPRELYALEANGLADQTTPRVPSVTNERLNSLNERSLAMHLHRAYNHVLGCQDALWEELKDRLRNRKEELEPFGWEDEEEFEEVHSREKFERLLERYRSDMHSRVSYWSSLHDLGWPLPAREPLSKAELIEEERMREAILEARRTASLEDQQLPCRSIRVLVGFKP